MNAPPRGDPRAAALAIFRARLEGDPEEEGAFKVAGVADQPAARGLARAIAIEALRRLGQIDAVLRAIIPRPPSGRERLAMDAMRVAAAEMLFMDRHPAMIVDSAVSLIKRDRRARRFAGLANAALRRLAREGRGMIAAQDAERLNAPDWLWRRMVREMGEAGARAAARIHAVPPPLDLTAREDAANWAERLGGTLTPTGSIRLNEAGAPAALAGYGEGVWWVQDAAAALPVRMLIEAAGGAAGKRALDLCAAPGGKTLQLAAAGAQTTAVDISDARLDRLRENLARTGLAAEVLCANALAWTPDAPPFDLVLLDAPCSALGTLRRHPEAAWRRDPAGLEGLTASQDALLDRAWALTAPGGVLCYAVCSFLREEGPDRAAAFRARHPDAQALAPRVSGAEGLIRDEALRIFPGDWAEIGGIDGFFVKCWRKLR